MIRCDYVVECAYIQSLRAISVVEAQLIGAKTNELLLSLCYPLSSCGCPSSYQVRSWVSNVLPGVHCSLPHAASRLNTSLERRSIVIATFTSLPIPLSYLVVDPWRETPHITVQGMMAQQQSSSHQQDFWGGLMMLAMVDEAGLEPAGGIVCGRCAVRLS